MKKPPLSRSAASSPSEPKLFKNQKEWEAWLEKYSGTRQKRIDQFVRMLAGHKTIHPPKKAT